LAKKKKKSPKSIPRTQADVDRGYECGVNDGVANAIAIFMMVAHDKFDLGDKIPDMWKEITKLSEEIKEKRVTLGDIRRVLLEEYNVRV